MIHLAVQLGDTRIILRPDGTGGQQLLIQATAQGEALARLLLSGAEAQRENGFLAVAHDADVDVRLLNLIDVLTDIRWAHPTWTQLALDLDSRPEGAP